MDSQSETAIPDLRVWHAELNENFGRIRRDRPESSIYGLEHGLHDRDLKRLITAVGASMRRHGTGEWWSDRWLPLVVVATEVGYRYRGTGKDYWPVLEATLNAEIGDSGRSWLSEYFSYANRTLAFKQPVDTPWTRLFRHIAWPIANAVAPVEIHRALAQSLQRMFVNPPANFDGDALAAALRTSGRLQGSARLNHWLADDTLAVALSRRLLRLEDDASLSVAVVDRIWGDLTADPVARAALSRATREHRLLQRQRRSPVHSRKPSTFQLLVPRDGAPMLLLRPPFLDADVSTKARRNLGGARAALWPGAAPVSLEALVTGRTIGVALDALPGFEDEFLPGLEARLSDTALVTLLRGMKPAIADLLLFAGDSDLKDAVDGRSVPVGERIWALIPTDRKLPDGARLVGSLCGASCIEIDTSTTAGLGWFSSAPAGSPRSVTLSVEGANQTGSGPRGPLFTGELHTLLKLRGARPDEVILARMDEAEVRLSAQNPYLLVEAGAGEGQIELISEATAEKLSVFGFTQTGTSSRLQTTPVEMLLDPADATADELIRGEVTLLIRSDEPLELPAVTVALVHGEREIFRGQQLRVRTPAVIGGTSSLMQELAARLGATALVRGAGLHLVAQAGAVSRQWWSLERPPRPVTWELHDDRWAAWIGPDELQVVSIDPERPLDDPQPATGDALSLRLPVSEGAPLDGFGLVAGAGLVKLGSTLDVTDDPRRRWSDDGNRSPARIIRSYIRWSAAETTNLRGELVRRPVADRLRAAAVAALCGREWARAEGRLRPPQGDLWSAVGEAAIDLGLTQAGFEMELSVIDRETLGRQLGARIRQIAPDLSSLPSDALSAFEQELDGAVNEAWIDVFQEIWSRDRRVIYEDPDAGNSGADWIRAAAEGRKRLEIVGLRARVLPQTRAKALAALDYGTISIAELVRSLDEVHVDLAPRGSGRWLDLDDLRRGLTLWTSPAQLAEEPAWPDSLERLLTDRHTCRAIRYAALRHLAARRSIVERVDVV